MSRELIESPCIKVCVVDDATGLCTGCGRSLAQIAAWVSLSADERRKIIDALASRGVAEPGKVGAK